MDPVLISAIIGGALLFLGRGRKKKKKVVVDLPELPPPVQPDDAKAEDAKMLAELGYSNTALSIEAFQYSFNFVQRAYKIWDRLLKTDGVMGVNTRGALFRAIAYVKKEGKSWEEIVAAARKALPQYQMTANDKGNLQSLGYKISATTVGDFQEDFNFVNLWWMDKYGDALVPVSLEEDGLIGPVTREAIARAQDAQNQSGTAWPDLVGQAGNA